MNIAQLKQLGAIYLENVTVGLRKYPNEICTLSKEEAYAILLEKCKGRNWKDVYADFYYHTFDREIQLKIESGLEEQEIAYIKNICEGKEADELIFPLDETLLSIIVKLNAEAVLFSTIYFVGEPRSTWWGNYNKEYVIFRER